MILLVAIMALASLQIIRQIESVADIRKNSFNILMRAEALMSDLVDAETGQRGFLVTGDVTYLEPYTPANDRIRSRLEELRPFASTSIAKKHVDVLTPLVDAQLQYMAHTIASRQRNDMSTSVITANLAPGKQLMDSIRSEFRTFIQEEEEVLAQHDIALHSSMRRLPILTVVACLFTLLLALFFAYLIYRESKHEVKNLLHLETQRLLDVQEDVNRQLIQANTTLHVSEEKLAVTLNSIDDAVIATDGQGRVTLLNPLAERLTGWTRVEAMNRPVEDIFHIIHADTREPYPVPVKETLAHGTTLGLANHTKVIARDGSECDIADSCAPIRDREGRVVGAVLVFRDVTERIRIDQILQAKNVALERASAIAEKANLAKSEFLSSMSHELRTPLSAILGFAQLIDSGSPALTASQKRGMDQILKAGWYLLDLINEILDLALIESGKLSLSMEPMSLSEVMRECHAMIELQAQKRELRVTFPEFDGPCFIQADRTRVKQVLVNLLSNAIKYNAQGGTVFVECLINPPGRVRVCVTDTGAGLTPDQLPQLFEPFNRLGQEANAEEGTGIGLVMAKRLVELMGGAIGVDSTVGKGSMFWIELNTTAEPQVNDSAPREINVAPTPAQTNVPLRTLLYVEDNPANLMLVEEIIARRPDIRLLSAPDGLSGIKIAMAALPDVILMDINLPGINGIQAMQMLAKDRTTAHIPVLALSANAMPRDIDRGLAAGFFRYLTKPVRVDAFLEALDEAMLFANKQTAGIYAEEKT